MRTKPFGPAGIIILCVTDAALDIDEAAFAEMLLGKLNELWLEDRNLMPLHVFSGLPLLIGPLLFRCDRKLCKRFAVGAGLDHRVGTEISDQFCLVHTLSKRCSDHRMAVVA